LMYLDAGSGAEVCLPPETVGAVSQTARLPLVVGGGITDARTAESLCEAGADVVVIGSALERPNPHLVADLKALYR
ncbi:MAG: geranylgeranylglyceryl/heptaprenylglyceryl phosphate synthase, partial [Bacteroidia bacterium]|nr:HisA/HisF-related TIM barrel protein [Bacteroidia bacterium]MDW8332940.1 geranylgeranylglyceryl/heptaprenylglyceryl phosphate synthase [Bacteroidia bacterium]